MEKTTIKIYWAATISLIMCCVFNFQCGKHNVLDPGRPLSYRKIRKRQSQCYFLRHDGLRRIENHA